MNIAGYQIIVHLTFGEISLIRAVRQKDDLPVILKVVDKENYNLRRVLEREFNATRELRIEGIAQPLEIINTVSSYMTCYQDPGGYFLAEIMQDGPLALEPALKITSQIIATLSRLYKRGISYQPLHPLNILVDQDAGTVCLLGHLGDQSSHHFLLNHEDLDAFLAPKYMAPEQTGKIQVIVDYHANFYSLGILLFEMLAGHLPYAAEDEEGWSYVHLAARTPQISELHPDIPSPVSNIIHKLMAKSVDERYQSTEGIAADLECCLLCLEQTREIEPFPIAQRDIPSKINFPTQLYERDQEFSTLVSLFEQAQKGLVPFALVAGPTGVGKTSLIRKFREWVLAHDGHFAISKSNSLGRKIPFETILSVCQNLMRNVLTMEPGQLAYYTARLTKALDRDIAILANNIPELANILCPLPDEEIKLSSAEAKTRFQSSIQKFLQVFASGQQPLVLFFDDLQWVDHSSLLIIEKLISSQLKHFVLIGAYREGLSDDNQPLHTFLTKLTQENNISTINLSSLSPEATHSFIAKTLRPTKSPIGEFARLVYTKTAGNPFHIRSFLSNLLDSNILFFGADNGWSWNLHKAARVAAAENVIDLITEKLKKLSPLTRWVVSIAATLEGPIEVEDLAFICNMKLLEINDHILQCIRLGVLSWTEQGIEFEHDQLKESAYLQIPEDKRAETHLKIGKLLTKKIDKNPEYLFKAVMHMNRAFDLVITPQDRDTLARLNLDAGRQARKAFDFISAFSYFMVGLKALGGAGWQTNYDIYLALHIEAAETALANGKLDEIEALCSSVIANAHILLDALPAYEIRIEANNARRQEEHALNECLSVLAMLGLEIPVNKTSAPDSKMLLSLLIKDVQAIIQCPPHEMPIMDSAHDQFASRLLVKAALMSGFVNERLYYVLVHKLIGLLKQKGISNEFAVALVMAGGSICVLSDDFDFGRSVAKYGINYTNPEIPTPCDLVSHFILANDVESFFLSSQDLSKIYEKTQHEAFAHGDPTLACICSYFHIETLFYAGNQLGTLSLLLNKYLEQNQLVSVERIELGLELLSTLIAKLTGKNRNSDEPSDISINIIAQRAWLADADESVQIISLCHELLFSLVTRDHDALEEVCLRAQGFTAVGLRGVLPFNFYYCLGLLDRHIHTAEDNQHIDFAVHIKDKYEGLKKRAQSAPCSYQHKLELINALLFQIEGKTAEAIWAFNKAIEGAAKNGYSHEEGLAAEMVAELHDRLGQKNIAGMYYYRSVRAYARWGGDLITERIYKGFSDYFSAIDTSYSQSMRLVKERSAKFSVETTTLLKIEKIKRSLVNELDISKLVQILIDALLKYTGAQKAALIVEHEGRLYVEALGSIDNEIVYYDNKLLQSCKRICHSIIRYVTRSHDTVNLGKAKEDGQFGNDPYIRDSNVKSLLCTPVIHQGKSVAFLYLENDAIEDLFTEEKESIITSISIETAVALQHARLTKELKAENAIRRAREAELESALAELSTVKKNIEHENAYLNEEISRTLNFEEIIGDSKPLKQVLNKIELVAPTNANVLVLGETGTGKELIARAIHNRSKRKEHTLVKVNCAALPSTLIESELFGHEKGAFTGALENKIGRFELAHKGTIFLDEIGDLPLELQAKLLRVLQEGEFERLGSCKTTKVDVRVIAATNRDLSKDVAKGVFRSDLYYRLSVFPVELPSLRERVGDIPILVRFFIKKYEAQLGKSIERIPADIMSAFESYPWPGNIRELQNVIERAMILSHGNTLCVDTSFHVSRSEVESTNEGGTLDEAKRNHIIKILDKCGWKISGKGNAADQLGVKPSTLRFRMGKLGIRRPS